MNINELLRPPPARAQHNEDVHAQPSVVDPRLLPHFEQSYSESQTPPNQPSSYYSSPYPSLEIIPVDLQEASKEKGAKRKRNAEASARCRERRALREMEAAQRISELEQTAQRISELEARISDLERTIQDLIADRLPHICARPCCSDKFPREEVTRIGPADAMQ